MERPIGYWLKRLDRLIEDAFDRALAAEGVSRRQWQTLNVLRRTPPMTTNSARRCGRSGRRTR